MLSGIVEHNEPRAGRSAIFCFHNFILLFLRSDSYVEVAMFHVEHSHSKQLAMYLTYQRFILSCFSYTSTSFFIVYYLF